MQLNSLFVILLFTQSLSAQKADSIPQKDVIDLVKSVLHHKRDVHKDTLPPKMRRIEMSIVPGFGISITSGLSAVVTSNGAFYLGNHATTSLSSVYTAPFYSIKKQLVLPIQANLWTDNNDYNILLDWRYMIFPNNTYGLGTETRNADAALMNFEYLHFNQSILKNLGNNRYVGIGYNLDYFLNTTIDKLPQNRVTDAAKYGITANSRSSGAIFVLSFDNRKNPINAKAGEQYLNVIYRNNLTALGSDNNWQSLLIEGRKFIQLGAKSSVLAFWTYNILNLSGTPPYQMLPSTGFDAYNNTGRGFAQGRFRGQNMLYLESEYRFRLRRSGLLGGVVFANVESFSEPTFNRFAALAFACGLGIRLKINKRSDTNLGVDYAFGVNSSSGIYINLGEVF
jgi:hypothetical protein